MMSLTIFEIGRHGLRTGMSQHPDQQLLNRLDCKSFLANPNHSHLIHIIISKLIERICTT